MTNTDPMPSPQLAKARKSRIAAGVLGGALLVLPTMAPAGTITIRNPDSPDRFQIW